MVSSGRYNGNCTTLEYVLPVDVNIEKHQHNIYIKRNQIWNPSIFEFKCEYITN